MAVTVVYQRARRRRVVWNIRLGSRYDDYQDMSLCKVMAL